MKALEQMRAECPKEYAAFLAAQAAGKKITGLSISGDTENLAELEKHLDFEPSLPASKEAKKRMLSHYRAEARKGMLGDGIFLID
jgi:hypothetical protein